MLSDRLKMVLVGNGADGASGGERGGDQGLLILRLIIKTPLKPPNVHSMNESFRTQVIHRLNEMPTRGFQRFQEGLKDLKQTNRSVGRASEARHNATPKEGGGGPRAMFL